MLSIAPGNKAAARAPKGKSFVTPLMQEFIDSRNDKAIYDRLKAKSQPSGEELWVMARILERCARVSDNKIFADAPRWADTLGTPEAKDRFAKSLSPRRPTAKSAWPRSMP